MTLVEETALDIVEEHLLALGAGNHADNMTRLRRFECHSLVALTEKEFLALVFLQNNEVLSIVPRGHDRRLRAVAERAISLRQPRLGTNWDLAANLHRMREKSNKQAIFREPLLICESQEGEEQHGPFYLQDGSHRALACATLMLLNEVKYEHQMAYCSMSNPVYQILVAPASEI